jgi:hypothetical protein
MTTLWLIERLLVKPLEGSNPDVVITADWRCNGSQDNYSGTCYGSCSFQPPSGSFTPYEDLTEQQVLDWCYENGVDKTAIEANVTAQINDQINPPVVVLPLPWVAQPLPPVPPPVEIVPPLVEQAVPVLVANDASVSDAPAA